MSENSFSQLEYVFSETQQVSPVAKLHFYNF